jgi:glycerol-3-phosphate dehydrogenase
MPAEKTIVVFGAGINGAAVARELALSGVGVIVVDDGDIATGATAWSTRLIHGGLRYLEYGEIGLVRESLVERNRLVKLAAHLVRPLPFYLPVEGRWGGMWAAAARLAGWESLARAWQGRRGRGSWTVGVGLTLYDLLAAGAGWPRHRQVRAGHDGMPQIDTQAFPRAALYSDAQLLFPERFTVELLVDARGIAAAGGTRFEVCTHREVQVGRDGMVTISGSPVVGGPVEIRPDAVINATGAWVDRTLGSLCVGRADGIGRRLIGGTKGSHLVVRNAHLRAALADHGVYAEAADGRPIFVLPFGAYLVLVGTTDIPFTGDPADSRTDEAEIGYLLAAVARLFPTAAVGRDDVQQHYCGVRPLPNVAGDPHLPAGVTRRHLLVRHDQAPWPLWSIVGGKLTTCRSLAETTAATVLGRLEVPVRGTSRERPLPGNCDGASRAAAVLECHRLAEQAGMSRDDAAAVADRVVGLLGARGPAVWQQEPGRLSGPPAASLGGLIRGVGLPTAIVGFCVREEWAATLDDLVERRLMLSFHDQLTREAIMDVAESLSMAGALAPERVTEAVDACVARLADRYGRIVPRSSDGAHNEDRTSQGSRR